jgi:hypothetical protein
MLANRVITCFIAMLIGILSTIPGMRLSKMQNGLLSLNIRAFHSHGVLLINGNS